MSVYLASSEDPGDQVASNTGWGDFGTWVETLDAAAYPDLCHLWDHGWAEPASAVRDQLAAARHATPPADPTVAATCALVAVTLGDFEADYPVVVSNGMMRCTGDDDDGPDDAEDAPAPEARPA